MAFCILADMKTLLTGITANVYRGEFPENLDCIGLFDTRGFDPTHTFGSQAPAYESPGFQVIVRHASFDTAKTWMESVKNALDGKTNFTINSHTYISVMQQGDTFKFTKRDEHRRIKLALNFIAEVTR